MKEKCTILNGCLIVAYCCLIFLNMNAYRNSLILKTTRVRNLLLAKVEVSECLLVIGCDESVFLLISSPEIAHLGVGNIQLVLRESVSAK